MKSNLEHIDSDVMIQKNHPADQPYGNGQNPGQPEQGFKNFGKVTCTMVPASDTSTALQYSSSATSISHSCIYLHTTQAQGTADSEPIDL